jgi:DNA recombination protein RmuC
MVIGIVIGVVIGALIVFAWHATNVSSMRAKVEAAERTARTEEQILESVKAAQNEALQGSGQMLVALAEEKMNTSTAKVETFVKPVADELLKLQTRVEQVERQRAADNGEVKGLVEQLALATRGLTSETHALNQAMKDNRLRGTWGEMQLRRVVELAGMQEHCDFDDQVHVVGEDRTGRPDLVVRLPQAKTIVVDSKAPLNSYIEAVNIGTTDTDAANTKLLAHATAMADHVTALSKRDYSTLVDGSVDFVVMFVPGEAFLSAAYEARPALFDDAIAKGVFIATPTTLIALLKAISYGWRQERLAENAKAIATTGALLLERLAKFTDTFAKVGTSLEQAQTRYNEAVGSFERRLLPTAREMRTHGVSVAEIEAPDRVDVLARPFTAAELAPGAGDGADQ